MTSKCQRDKNQNIQVFVRVRPINSNEKNSKSLTVVDCPNNREVIVKERPSDRFTRTFAFDRVFGPNSRQIDVYMTVVHPMISEVLAGYNCTVFAYGQTGTGKTFTMEGERSQNVDISWDNDPLSGIIPRALSNLFDELRILQVEFTVRVSFLELYNEELIDLLSPSNDPSKIRLFEDTTKKGSVIIQGLEELLVDNKNQVYSIMEKGSIKRQTASTLMNAQSSRSHTVFSITVHIKENSVEGEELVKTGKLNLVDLAGSENIGRSGAVDKRAREAGNINQSLLTLGRVITALVERTPHVPYRESKLTRLLQDSLGGRTKTSIIATISPASCNLDETLSTLDYAHRAKNITNRPEINQKLTKKTIIKEYTAEIERLRRDLQATRDKNGVYLANENYTKMTLQIEQQEQEISQYLGQIKALREEMEKKEEICNQLNVSLEVCSDKLASTFAELGDTQEKLMNTINVCNEKCHLLDKHMETEEKLSIQAQSLLAVADMASTDTEKLHDKLARKRSVESENEDTTHHFHTSFVQNIAHMQDNVNRFSQDLTKFCLGLQTNLGERLEKRSVELTSLSNEMSSFVDSRTQLIQDLEKIFSNQVYNGQQLIQQFLTTVRSTSDTEVNNLHTFLTETFLAPMRSMSRQLQLIEAETQTFSRTVLEQLQQQMDGMKTFETSQRDALSQLRDNTLLQFKQQEQSLEQSEEGVRAMEKASSAYKEAFTSEVQQLKSWADRFLSMYGEFDMHYSDNKSKIKNGLSTAREKCDHLSQVTSSTLEQQLKRRAEHISTYETQTEEMIDSIGNSRQTLDQLISGTKRLDEELEAGIRSSVSNGERAWRNHYSWTEQELRKYSENLNGELQRELKQTQDLVTGLRESAESHEAILEQQRLDFGTFVRERQDDLDSQCSYISSWSQSIVSELQQRNQDVDKFLVEDLRRDIATGNTPERRGFVYPRELAATSPHERILARYREMNDAASFKLPKEDSKLSRISSSPESLGAEDLSSETESLKGTRGKSMSSNDIPESSDSFLNTSLRSEPATLQQSDNKENSRMSSMKKYHSEDLKTSKQLQLPKRTLVTRKALGPQN